METSKKNLIILIDYIDFKSIDASLLEKCDRVAMTPDAMLAFEAKGLSYLTFEDFYDYKQFRNDNLGLIKASEDLLSQLDRKYQSFLDFPQAFSGNILWFLIFFTNVFYISRICRKIKKTYDTTYLVGSVRYDKLFTIELEFSLEGLAFHKCNKGLINKVSMVRACLQPECLWLDNRGGERNVPIDKRRLIYVLKRISDFLPRWTDKRRTTAFVIQDGYEVRALKKSMPQFSYINPLNALLRKVRDANVNTQMDPLFSQELENFIKEWFPDFERYIVELFTLYHKKIACRLNAFWGSLSRQFERYKPEVLLYSLSANRVYEVICAYLANQKDIPVFYFQHGGTSIFFEHPHKKYFEEIDHIKKINILQSKVEQELLLGGASSSDGQVLGSIRLHALSATHNPEGLRQARRKALYCPCFFSHYNYKNLIANASDRELFEVNKDVVDVVGRFGLDMDIKIHPSDELYNYVYFNSLLKIYKSNTIRVLKGIPAEEIIKEYGLLVLDSIGTALVPVAIVLNIPTILYLKDVSSLRKEVIPDFEKRFYFVQSKTDLEKYINLYVCGKLASKFSIDIVDKFAFPVDVGNPAVNIPAYIQARVLHSRQ
jgi:hypothetical protein